MAGRYLIRLDDACATMNIKNWELVEDLLDCNGIKPIIGVIPNNEDETIAYNEEDTTTNNKDDTTVYRDINIRVENFWRVVNKWREKGYAIALHGYNHRYISANPGIIPINNKSEFAGIKLEDQSYKIREGIKIFKERGIDTRIFFAPSHSLDQNTLKAISQESNINIICDGFAINQYYEHDFYWIPQQFWRFRKIPFGLWTTCVHPNTMSEAEFRSMKIFIEANASKFVKFEDIKLEKRVRNIFDYCLEKYYFMRRRL